MFYVLIVIFITFWYFFYFVKFEYGGMLASGFWKNLLYLTHYSWIFSWVFCMCFTVIWISLYFTFLDFYYWSLFWDSLLYCLTFCGNQLFEFCCNYIDWLSHYVGSGCGRGISEQITNSFVSFLLLFTYTLRLCSSLAVIFWVHFLLTF